MDRPENITKFTQLEIEIKSERAALLYDTFTKDTLKNITPKQAFILGYLHGSEKSYDEFGMFDDIDDDSKIYEFLQNNDKYNQPKKPTK
jgi:hypothetical protein